MGQPVEMPLPFLTHLTRHEIRKMRTFEFFVHFLESPIQNKPKANSLVLPSNHHQPQIFLIDSRSCNWGNLPMLLFPLSPLRLVLRQAMTAKTSLICANASKVLHNLGVCQPTQRARMQCALVQFMNESAKSVHDVSQQTNFT